MELGQSKSRLLVCFNFHPTQGSEEAVGWIFARLSSEVAPTVVYTQASYEGKITAEDRALLPDNLEIRYYRPGWLKDWLKSRLLPVSFYYKLWHLGLYWHLRKVLREERYSSLHVCTWVSAIHSVATVLLPLPTIWGPLGGVARPPFSFYRPHGLKWMCKEAARLLSIALAPWSVFLRRSYGGADVVLAAADDCRDWIVEHNLADRERVRVLPAITFPEQLAEEPSPKRVSRPAEPSVLITTASRFLPWKGLDLLLEGLAASRRTEMFLRVFGDGPDRTRLEALVARLGIGSQVEFAGFLPRQDVLEGVAVSDLFVLPSLHDSEAGASMEAAGLGVPVLALDYGGAQSCLRGCAQTTFLSGGSREEIIAGIAGHLKGTERATGDRGGPSGNIPDDSLLLFRNKREMMRGIYEELPAPRAD